MKRKTCLHSCNPICKRENDAVNRVKSEERVGLGIDEV